MFSNPVQFELVRNSLFLIDKCTDTAIGFEFLTEILESTRRYCNKIYLTECQVVQVPAPLELKSIEFLATEDPCLKDWVIIKNKQPDIEMESNDDGNIISVAVRFFSNESSCYPQQMTFILNGYDSNGCKSTLSRGLIVFK